MIFCSLPLTHSLAAWSLSKKIIKYELSGIHPHIFKHCRIVSSSTFSYFVYISCVAPLARGEESSLFFSIHRSRWIFFRVLSYGYFFWSITSAISVESENILFVWFLRYFFSTLRQSNSKNFEWIIYEWERSGFMWHWKWRRVTKKNQKVMNTTLSLCKYLFAFII